MKWSVDLQRFYGRRNICLIHDSTWCHIYPGLLFVCVMWFHEFMSCLFLVLLTLAVAGSLFWIACIFSKRAFQNWLATPLWYFMTCHTPGVCGYDVECCHFKSKELTLTIFSYIFLTPHDQKRIAGALVARAPFGDFHLRMTLGSGDVWRHMTSVDTSLLWQLWVLWYHRGAASQYWMALRWSSFFEVWNSAPWQLVMCGLHQVKLFLNRLIFTQC